MNLTCDKKRGFTLLEVLIAIAIFSLISLAGFTIFNTVLDSENAAKARIKRLNDIQHTFLIMERDFIQLARRTVRVEGEAPLKGFLHSQQQGSFDNDSDNIAFVRGGWTNPALLMPRSDLQSVAYRLKDETLERLYFNFVDPEVGKEPKIRPLLKQVKSLNFAYFYGKKWQKQLLENAIPMAIAVELQLDDYGTIRREFLLAGDLSPMKEKQ